MKGIKHECQLMERCDHHDHVGGVRECGKRLDSCQEV